MKKNGFRLGISVLFTFAAVIEIAAVIILMETISYIFKIPRESISGNTVFWGVGICIGGAMAWLVNRILLRPIKKLSEAMDEVASGNFDVHLETGNRIKEIRNIYEKFNVMTKELRSTEILQGNFISNVSHEIKTPITSIEGYTMLLQNNEISNENKKEFTEKILFNTRKLSQLVGNILLLSKIDNQSIEKKKKKYRLDEQIRQSLLMLEPKWLDKNVEFEVDLDYAVIEGNESMLQHVWNNLIDNAVKYSPKNGLIKMDLKESQDKWIFSISDEGPGIKEEDKNKIFQKFYQSDGSHKQEGNGLGLALVKQILNLYNAKIFVENLPEKGCRFIVELNK